MAGTGTLLRAALVTASTAGFLGCAHHAASGHHQHRAGADGIFVSGNGEAQAEPDLARTSLGVEIRAGSVDEAMQQANAQMERLLGVLKAQGIADSDLRTQGFSVSYDRDYVRPTAAEEPAAAPMIEPTSVDKPGKKPAAATRAAAVVVAQAAPVAAAAQRGAYVVSNTVEATLRQLDKLGQVLSAATAAGANNVWGITFDIADKQPLIDAARAQAFVRAKQNAARVAELSGLKLGEILQVTDGATAAPPIFAGMEMRAQAYNAAPIERGQLTVSHQVSVHYGVAHVGRD